MKKLTLIVVALMLLHLSLFSQFLNRDSIELENSLNKFKKHLDENSVTPSELTELLKNKSKQNFPVVADGTSEKNVVFAIPQKYFDNSIPKYSFNEIIANDTNHTLFIETEYELDFRPMLLYLKDSYLKEKKVAQKAGILLEYISWMAKVYPQYPNWEFSKSNTLLKYVQTFEQLTNSLPRDTVKAFLLVAFSDMLVNMNRGYWRYYALSHYLIAEKILLSPYYRKLKKGTVRYENEYTEYKDFILTSTQSIPLSNIYVQIYKTLTPTNWFDKTNSLVPLTNKRLFYLNKALYISSILDSSHKIEKRYIWNYERLFFEEYTIRYFKKNNKYSNQIFLNYNYLLQRFVSRILPQNDISIPPEQKLGLYKCLGNIFYSLNEPEYAIKAYYKVLEQFMNRGVLYQNMETENIFAAIFRMMKQLVKREGAISQKDELTRLYERFDQLPYEPRDSSLAAYRNFQARKTTNAVTLLLLENKMQQAKELLFKARKTAFFDTLDISSSLTILYDELNYNEWLQPKASCETSLEKSDSMAYSYYHNEQESNFEGNPYIEQIYSSWNQQEADAFWNFNMDDLKDEIKVKEKKIEELNKKTKMLEAINTGLADTIEKKTKILSELFKSAVSLNKSNEKLQGQIRDSTTRLVELSQKNITLGSINKNLNDNNKILSGNNEKLKLWNTVLWPVAVILGIGTLLLFVSVKALRKQKRQLNSEIKNLQIIKSNLEGKVVGLNTTMEANRITHENEVKYKNAKILKELTMKHEIVGLF